MLFRLTSLGSVALALSQLLVFASCESSSGRGSGSGSGGSTNSDSCRNIPGDAGWPSVARWNSLNATVGGRLIATTPVASVCHDPTFSSAACGALKAEWGLPKQAIYKPAEFLSPWFHNQTCVPYTNKTTACRLGNYASYSIDVRNVKDITSGIAFAQKNNIRLVIKNTGHDFLAKSTGKGALSLWTHNLNSISLINRYSSTYYRGPALKVGAGVFGGDAQKYATERGYRLVTGFCPSVGLAGGYTQGGGFGPLSGLYGLGADNVLEWEVITAAGQHLIATPAKNQDLYYALGGGGGGTFGVVVSMTVRVFPDPSVSAASLIISAAAAGSVDNYWNAIAAFHRHVPTWADQHGILSGYTLMRDMLIISIILAPDGTVSESELRAILKPFTDELLTISPTLTQENLSFGTSSNSTWYNMYSSNLEPILADQPPAPVAGGRFFSRTHLSTNLPAIINSMKKVTATNNFMLVCIAANIAPAATKKVGAAPVADNGVTPDWRTAVAECYIPAIWSWAATGGDRANVEALQRELMEDIMPVVEAATPGGGAYMNEASWAQPNFQAVFYGNKYDKLKYIKKKWDPKDFFWANTAVGSEAWAPDAEGRLCRTSRRK